MTSNWSKGIRDVIDFEIGEESPLYETPHTSMKRSSVSGIRTDRMGRHLIIDYLVGESKTRWVELFGDC